ncbi:DUF6265 family protein [Marinifilum caeruleilacunae]|uniref:DUF6265 domain-containing protein n=1 Tax=Marinifilum caeruleilacunae TaxID=2499076 RepID=A0ABX1WZF8_9BACT|nr:DUF6265 family protein [Marinifilum caeruleilacunae]NOU61512.1 hypothetical protein [Marinifilum caeruleilacunae]
MKYILLFLLSVTIFSCSKSNMHELDFLSGTWQIEGKQQFEKWEKKADGLLGTGYKIEDGKEKLLETLAITYEKGHWIYHATVANQNQGATISFYLNTNVSEVYSFENTEHDFPKKIQYQIVDSNRLKVNVLGEGEKGFTFLLNRVEKENP